MNDSMAGIMWVNRQVLIF